MVQLTPLALENIRRVQSENEIVGHGLRFGIEKGGCSGYMYVLEFEEAPTPDDEVMEVDGVRVFIKKDQADKLRDATIDWVDNLMTSGFQINSPVAKRPCGCGESVDF